MCEWLGKVSFHLQIVLQSTIWKSVRGVYEPGRLYCVNGKETTEHGLENVKESRSLHMNECIWKQLQWYLNLLHYQTFLTLVTLSTLSSCFEWTVKKPAEMVWKMSPVCIHTCLNISLYDIFDCFYIFSADIIIVLSGHPRWRLDKKFTKLE